MSIIKDKNDIIGNLTIKTQMKTRYARGSEQYKLMVNVNFAGCTVEQVLQWAIKQRIIQFQRVLRDLPSEEAFAGFHEAGDEVSIFAIEASNDLEDHTTVDELVNNNHN